MIPAVDLTFDEITALRASASMTLARAARTRAGLCCGTPHEPTPETELVLLNMQGGLEKLDVLIEMMEAAG